MNSLPVAEITKPEVKPGYQKRPVLQDVLINWQQMSAVEICNLVRACNPWNKGAMTFLTGQEIKILDAVVVSNITIPSEYQKAGTIVQNDDKLLFYCSDGQAISSNMLFFNDAFIAAYQCKYWGLTVGLQLG